MVKVDYELIMVDTESLGVTDTEEFTLSCKHFIVHFMLGVTRVTAEHQRKISLL